VPIGSLLSVLVILMFSGLAFAQLLQKSVSIFTKTVPKRKRWGAEDKRQPGLLPESHPRREQDIRTRVRRGRKKGGTICNKRAPVA
jgi:hypothetical protein